MSIFNGWPVVAWRKSFGRTGPVPTAVPVRVEDISQYAGSRDEARAVAEHLGLDVTDAHWEVASIGDFLRLAYAGGWKAHEHQMLSPNRADDIALAIKEPKKILAEANYTGGTTNLNWQVRAVQQAAVYGAPNR